MKILKIMNFFPPHHLGGAENSAYHTCVRLIEEGVQCHVLAINHRGSNAVDERYTFDGIHIHQVEFLRKENMSPWQQIFDKRIFKVVQAELAEVKPDLVHIHNVSGATMAPYLACRMVGVPVVNTLHDLWLLCPCNMLYQRDGTFCDPRQYPQGCQNCFRRYDYWGAIPQRRQAMAWLTDGVATFISPSQALIDQHVYAGYDPARFQMIPYAVSEDSSVPPTHPELKKLIATADQYQTVVFAGGGIQSKGVMVLLKAIPHLLRHIPHLRVVVAGGGESHFISRLQQYEPCVQFIGKIPNKEIQHFFAAADLTLVPSTWHENSPVVIYESFKVGTPVVGSNFGGIPELIEPGVTGYLFPTGDAAQLAAQIITYFALPPAEKAAMQAACQKTVQTRLTMDNHIAGILDVYRAVTTAA